MKIKLSKKLIAKTVVVFILLLPVILVSCMKEDSETKPKEKNDNTTITFELKVPAGDRSKSKEEAHTRALSSENENEIRNVVVIAFKGGKYYYRATPRNGVTNNIFKVSLIEGKYEIMVLTNCNDKLPPLSPTQTKKEVLDALTIALKDSSGNKWIVNTLDEDYIATPMASLVQEETIASTDEFNKKSVKLYRMLGKVNVSVQGAAQTNFQLNSVYLYNVNTNGSMVPLFDDNKDYKANIPNQSRFLGPVIYKFTETHSYLNEIYLFEALNHDALDVVLDWDKRTCLVVGGLYAGGAKTTYYRIDLSNKVGTEMSYYDILRNHIYKVNVVKVTGGGFENKEDAFKSTPIDMEVKIQAWNVGEITDIETDGVYSLGVSEKSIEHTSPAQSINTIKVKSDYPEEIKINISASATDPNITQGVEWLTEAKLTYVDNSDGLDNYLLNYDLSKNGTDASRTGYIHITAGIIDLVVKVTQVKIYIRITEKVGNDWVEIDNLTFTQDSKDLAATIKRYRIEWTPNSGNLSLSLSPTGGEYKDITWLQSPLSQGTNIAGSLGQVEFTIQPNKMEDFKPGKFVEAQTTLNLSLPSEGATKTLVLRQYIREIYVETALSIPMDGKSNHYVTIKSNVPWEVYLSGNTSMAHMIETRVIESIGLMLDAPHIPFRLPVGKTYKVAEGEGNLPDGTRIPITTVDDIFTKNEVFYGSIGLYGQSPKYPNTTSGSNTLCLSGVIQDGREANCYVVMPDRALPILIPVRAANGKMTDKYKIEGGVGGSDLHNGGVAINANTITNTGPNSTYGARLIWADHGVEDIGNMVGRPSSLIQSIIPIVNGENGYILVHIQSIIGSREGNAVVAVTRNADGTGEILWSWHIWITSQLSYEGESDDRLKTRILPGEYNINNYWLDRNLGASNRGDVGYTDIHTYGLHYQWGRKDPFPGANKMKITTAGQENERQLYDANGKIPMNGDHGSVSYVGNGTTVPISIQNPLTFYHQTSSQDWLTTPNHTLWGTTHGGTTNDETEHGTDLGKTIFDPCPAGYRVPVRVSKKWDDYTNTKHWGSDVSDVNTAMGDPTVNMSTDYGFRWMAYSRYKGDWYSTAGARYQAAGLQAGGVGSVGYYWSSSSLGGSGRNMTFDRRIIPSTSNYRHAGFSVRCVAY